ncbi:MAG: hypothetical protein LUH03_09880 [Oscillospiraceae bacterium]|nr:hypothetical protein [Oscillospiraceae bacterium]
MTIQDLSRYSDLRAKLQQDQEILDSLRAKAAPASPALTGMPHATGTSDKVGYLATEIAYLEGQTEKLKSEMAQERRCLEAYIKTIKDDRVYVICSLRFLRCLSWDEVADTLGMYYTGIGARKIVSAYLRDHP